MMSRQSWFRICFFAGLAVTFCSLWYYWWTMWSTGGRTLALLQLDDYQLVTRHVLDTREKTRFIFPLASIGSLLMLASMVPVLRKK